MKNRTETVRRHIEALRVAQQDNRDLVQGYTKEQLVKSAQGTLRKIADDLRKAASTAEVQDAANDLDKLAIGWGLFLRYMPYPSIVKSIDLYEALLGDIESLKASLVAAQERAGRNAGAVDREHLANKSLMAQNKHLCAEVESLQIALKFRSGERDKALAENAAARDRMKAELTTMSLKYTSALSERNAMKDALAAAQGAYTKLQSEIEAAQRRDTETLRAAHHTNKTLTAAMREAFKHISRSDVREARRALETVLGVSSARVGFNIWFDGTRRAFVPAPDGRFVGFNGTEGFFTTDVNLICDDRATLDLKGYPAPSDTAVAEAKRLGWSW